MSSIDNWIGDLRAYAETSGAHFTPKEMEALADHLAALKRERDEALAKLEEERAIIAEERKGWLTENTRHDELRRLAADYLAAWKERNSIPMGQSWDAKQELGRRYGDALAALAQAVGEGGK